jgi:hypothetical protein
LASVTVIRNSFIARDPIDIVIGTLEVGLKQLFVVVRFCNSRARVPNRTSGLNSFFEERGTRGHRWRQWGPAPISSSRFTRIDKVHVFIGALEVGVHVGLVPSQLLGSVGACFGQSQSDSGIFVGSSYLRR